MRVDELYPRDRVTLREVGLRDGLQMVRQHPTTAQKRRWIDAARRARVRNMELGSFLPADRYPQFADVDAVVAHARALGDVFASTLALNKRGAMRALEAGVDEIVFVVSASEVHNLANANRTREVTMREIVEAMALRGSGPDRPVASVAIAMSFGCSIAGASAVTNRDVLDLAGAALEAGADVINVADTVGYAGPTKVRSLAQAFRAAFGDVPLGFHFHDTRELGLANAAVALEEGALILDASIGGLGGCPFAPGATGNIVFEDLVFLTRIMGLPTGIDPLLLNDVRAIATEAMPDEPLHGHMHAAGLPRP